MIKTLNNTIKQDRTVYKIPRSVQDVIPIQRIFADGIFQFGTKYSRTLRFSDINYAIASKEDKTAMFLGYSELLNALDSGSTTKLTICNKQVNRQAFEDTVLLPQRGDVLLYHIVEACLIPLHLVRVLYLDPCKRDACALHTILFCDLYHV